MRSCQSCHSSCGGNAQSKLQWLRLEASAICFMRLLPLCLSAKAYLGVQGRQRVIKQIDISICVDGTGHGDSLLLTPADIHSSLSKLSLVTTWILFHLFQLAKLDTRQLLPTITCQAIAQRCIMYKMDASCHVAREEEYLSGSLGQGEERRC